LELHAEWAAALLDWLVNGQPTDQPFWRAQQNTHKLGSCKNIYLLQIFQKFCI
jgi:hypothetical protein